MNEADFSDLSEGSVDSGFLLKINSQLKFRGYFCVLESSGQCKFYDEHKKLKTKLNLEGLTVGFPSPETLALLQKAEIETANFSSVVLDSVFVSGKTYFILLDTNEKDTFSVLCLATDTAERWMNSLKQYVKPPTETSLDVNLVKLKKNKKNDHKKAQNADLNHPLSSRGTNETTTKELTTKRIEKGRSKKEKRATCNFPKEEKQAEPIKPQTSWKQPVRAYKATSVVPEDKVASPLSATFPQLSTPHSEVVSDISVSGSEHESDMEPPPTPNPTPTPNQARNRQFRKSIGDRQTRAFILQNKNTPPKSDDTNPITPITPSSPQMDKADIPHPIPKSVQRVKSTKDKNVKKRKSAPTKKDFQIIDSPAAAKNVVESPHPSVEQEQPNLTTTEEEESNSELDPTSRPPRIPLPPLPKDSLEFHSPILNRSLPSSSTQPFHRHTHSRFSTKKKEFEIEDKRVSKSHSCAHLKLGVSRLESKPLANTKSGHLHADILNSLTTATSWKLNEPLEAQERFEVSFEWAPKNWTMMKVDLFSEILTEYETPFHRNQVECTEEMASNVSQIFAFSNRLHNSTPNPKNSSKFNFINLTSALPLEKGISKSTKALKAFKNRVHS
eukprot:TRINITY_DN14748_c0_g1_i1.p1 TRINITY_DN14748_c0_g1~~TRINITY_DN14748_c0_g1_i1.p1  ORF type:complete len:641 (+),score=172.97 TRINITY_DN14748_c0_g1_i1:83-1924(+)